MSGYLRRQLGSNAILIESDKRETGDIGLSERENQFWANRVETATTDPRFITGVNRGDSDRSNGQRDISNSPDQLDPDPWLAMSRKTLFEIGVDDERTRKQTDERFRRASRAVQTGSDESVQQKQWRS